MNTKNSNVYKNDLKRHLCYKYRFYITLIADIGNGVMFLSHIEQFAHLFLNISPKTVYRHLKDLKAAQILADMRIHNVKAIYLRKFAYRFIRELETGEFSTSKDTSAPHITEQRIKKSAWLTEYILTKLMTKHNFSSIDALINYLHSNTTLITNHKHPVQCFNQYIDNQDIDKRLRNNVKQEIDKLNEQRELQKQHLIHEAKTRNTPTSTVPTTPINAHDKTFNFFTFLDYNMYITQIDKDTLTICFFNYNNTFNLTKFYIILDKLNDYIRERLFSYTEDYEIQYGIKIKLYFYMDTKKQVTLLKNNIQESYNTLYYKAKLTEEETKHLQHFSNFEILSAALNISAKCYKNENIIF